MKLDITIDQASLHRVLRLAGRIAPVKAMLPVLQHVLIDATPEGMTLTATDMEVGVVTTVPAQVAAPGRVAAPARLLDDFVGQLPPGPVRLTLDGSSSRLRLTCGRFTAGFATADPDEFPAIPDPGDCTPLEVDANALRAAIERVAFAASRDDTRPVLKGVEFRLEASGLTLTACDGYRLARARIAGAAAGDGAGSTVIVPARGAAEFARLLAGVSAARLLVAQGAGCARLHAGDTVVLARLMEGPFPDVDRVIPTEWRTRVRLETAELRRAVSVAATFWASNGGHPLRLEAAAGGLRLRARGPELGDAECELPAHVEGESQAVSLGTPYLAEVLAAVHTDEVELALREPLMPVVVRESGGGHDEGDNGNDTAGDCWVLMPMLTVGEAAPSQAPQTAEAAQVAHASDAGDPSTRPGSPGEPGDGNRSQDAPFPKAA